MKCTKDIKDAIHYADVLKQIIDDFFLYNHFDEYEFMDAYYSLAELCGGNGE
jgi:hypothetical protein